MIIKQRKHLWSLNSDARATSKIFRVYSHQVRELPLAATLGSNATRVAAEMTLANG